MNIDIKLKFLRENIRYNFMIQNQQRLYYKCGSRVIILCHMVYVFVVCIYLYQKLHNQQIVVFLGVLKTNLLRFAHITMKYLGFQMVLMKSKNKFVDNKKLLHYWLFQSNNMVLFLCIQVFFNESQNSHLICFMQQKGIHTVFTKLCQFVYSPSNMNIR